MINPSFDPKKDHPAYYYLDRYGCPLYTKEEYNEILKEEEEGEKRWKEHLENKKK